MNWVQRKIYLYNVTFGLYMLDWWERLIFNAVVLVLMWFVCLNGVHHISEIYRSCMVRSCLKQTIERYSYIDTQTVWFYY